MRRVEIAHHTACDGYEATTVAYVDPTWADDAVAAAVREAQQRYLAALREAPAAPPEATAPPRPEYEKYPDRTVREVRAEWEERKAAADAYREHWRKHSLRFADVLFADERFAADDPATLELGLDWGHNHGLGIRF